MSTTSDQDLVRELIAACRYLVLSTTDGSEPWVAPLEYLCDENLNFYFLSTDDSRHVQHILRHPRVALAIFDTKQPDYAPGLSTTLRGMQISGLASRLAAEDHPESVVQAIAALNPPMPPYSVFRIVPSAFYLPTVVNGVNKRVEVQMG